MTAASEVIRLAGAADLAIVQALSRAAYAVYESELGFKPLPAQEDYGPRIEAGQVYLLQSDEGASAVLVLEQLPDHLLIYSLAVEPLQQGRGLGKRLMAFAEREAGRRGVKQLRLYTNSLMSKNRAFYQTLGYQEFDRTPHPRRPGAALVHFWKTLTED